MIVVTQVELQSGSQAPDILRVWLVGIARTAWDHRVRSVKQVNAVPDPTIVVTQVELQSGSHAPDV